MIFHVKTDDIRHSLIDALILDAQPLELPHRFKSPDAQYGGTSQYNIKERGRKAECEVSQSTQKDLTQNETKPGVGMLVTGVPEY